jgi:GTPase Era involved in 16S rRNA processing
MAYDIYLGLTEKEASMSLPALSIDENLHDYVFMGNDKELQKYTLLSRIQNYYSEAVYQNEELNDFLTELIEFKKIFSIDKRKVKLAEELIKVCNVALKQDVNVYCLGD